MKSLFKKILIICAIIAGASFVANYSFSQSVFADNNNPNQSSSSGGSSCNRSFFGLVPWHCNTNFGTNNNSKIPTEDEVTKSIWVIVANIVTDITVIAAYLVLGYTIYGGYLYTMSGGDPNKVATGKKTLAQAFIGLAIVLSAAAIMNTIRIALSINNLNTNCATTSCANPVIMITSTVQWVIGVIGVVAAIFIVYGGISYTTSSGDPSKLKKAKDMILYALIGLIIVALAEIITAFVSGTISDAVQNSNINNQTTISKEVHEINHL